MGSWPESAIFFGIREGRLLAYGPTGEHDDDTRKTTGRNRRESARARNRARPAAFAARAHHAGLFRQMRGEARLRAERAHGLRLRYAEAFGFRRHVRQSD